MWLSFGGRFYSVCIYIIYNMCSIFFSGFFREGQHFIVGPRHRNVLGWPWPYSETKNRAGPRHWCPCTQKKVMPSKRKTCLHVYLSIWISQVTTDYLILASLRLWHSSLLMRFSWYVAAPPLASLPSLRALLCVYTAQSPPSAYLSSSTLL